MGKKWLLNPAIARGSYTAKTKDNDSLVNGWLILANLKGTPLELFTIQLFGGNSKS